MVPNLAVALSLTDDVLTPLLQLLRRQDFLNSAHPCRRRLQTRIIEPHEGDLPFTVLFERPAYSRNIMGWDEELVIQKGHVVNYGSLITGDLRLSGAQTAPGAFDIQATAVRTNRSTQHWTVQITQPGDGGAPNMTTTATVRASDGYVVCTISP